MTIVKVSVIRKFPFVIDGRRLEKIIKSAKEHPCQIGTTCCWIPKGTTYYKISDTMFHLNKLISINTKKLCPTHFKEVVGDSVIEREK